MKAIIRILVPFVSGMIYVLSDMVNATVFPYSQEINWMSLGAIASIPSYIVYYIGE